MLLLRRFNGLRLFAMLRRAASRRLLTSAVLTPLSIAPTAWGAHVSVTCLVQSKYILSRSASGVARVSNRGSVEMDCSIPTRPLPNKPGQFRNGLTVTMTAYAVFPDGSKRVVTSEASTTGGGYDSKQEYVSFDARIPLGPRELDAEAQRFIAKAKDELAKSTPPQFLTAQEEQGISKGLGLVIPQQKVGRYLLLCHVLDGDRLVGTGEVQVEVLFKGHYLDALPATPSSVPPF